MRCDREQMLSRYAAGECDPRERAAIAAHLGGCPGCAARLAELRELDALLDLWQPEPAPEDLLESVMQAVGRPSSEGGDRHCRQAAPVMPGRTAQLLCNLGVAAALALAIVWGTGPWLSGSRAMAGESADSLVNSYARASDAILQQAVNTTWKFYDRINFEEWVKR